MSSASWAEEEMRTADLGDEQPGPKAMWTGLQRLRDFIIAFEARDALTGTCVY